jgi:DNA-binding GntR family transcriptional regulator
VSSLAQTAYEQIRQRIASGEFSTDVPLSEAALAESLRVSRTPVREAIHRLKSEGLLEQRPRSGTYVRRHSRAELRHALEVRILVEPLAAARAARKRRPECLRRLAELHADMKRIVADLKKATMPEEIKALSRRHLQSDRLFHETIHREIDNPRLFQTVSAAHIVTLGLNYLHDWPEHFPHMIEASNAGHARMLEAIKKGDVRGTRQLVRRNALMARRTALDYFDWLNS